MSETGGLQRGNVDFILEYGLVAVFVSLLLAPFGLSVPEEGSILAAGVLVHLGAATWMEAALVAYVGVICADSTIYAMGRKFGFENEGFVSRFLGQKTQNRIERFYDRHGLWTLVLCRPTPGIRSTAFFFAGATGVPYSHFLGVNVFTTIAAVAAYVALGAQVGEHFEEIMGFIQRFQRAFGILLLITVAVLASRALRRRIDRAQTDGSGAV